MPLEVDLRSRLFAKAPQSVGEIGLAGRALGADRRAFAYREFGWQVLPDRYNLVQLVVARLVDSVRAKTRIPLILNTQHACARGSLRQRRYKTRYICIPFLTTVVAPRFM